MTRRTLWADDDSGLSLVEMLVAVAIFAVLTTMVSAGMIIGLRAIQSGSQISESEQDQANAMEWVSRLVRYAAAPPGVTFTAGTSGSVIKALPTDLVFYTYAGIGPRHGIPYKAEVVSSTLANGSRVVDAKLWQPSISPTVANPNWSWSGTSTDTLTTRRLLTLPAGTGAPLKVSVTKCNLATDCYSTRVVATPNASGVITLAEGWVLDTVTISLGDPSDPTHVVTQQIALVNET